MPATGGRERRLHMRRGKVGPQPRWSQVLRTNVISKPALTAKNIDGDLDLPRRELALALAPCVRALYDVVRSSDGLVGGNPVHRREQFQTERRFEAFDQRRDAIESSACVGMGLKECLRVVR